MIFVRMIAALLLSVQAAEYTRVGCFKDTSNRALPTLEGKDSRLDGRYEDRADPIEKCYQAAKARGFSYFAVQNGGWCAAGNDSYDKYGKATNCAGGEGGGWANDVYSTVGMEIENTDDLIPEGGFVLDPELKALAEEAAKRDEDGVEALKMEVYNGIPGLLEVRLAGEAGDVDNWDWRDHGAVGPVRHQGGCGGCWAFAAAAAIESRNYIRNGGQPVPHQRERNTVIPISEQHILDCTPWHPAQIFSKEFWQRIGKGEFDMTDGCAGSGAKMAFDTMGSKGFSEGLTYPYTAKDKECPAESAFKSMDHPKGKHERIVELEGSDYWLWNPEGMKREIRTNGPCTVAMHVGADTTFDADARAGRIYECSGNKFPNHEMAVIGYGKSEDGHPYWLVKNSWGAGWGERGYVKVSQRHCKMGLFGVAFTCPRVKLQPMYGTEPLKSGQCPVAFPLRIESPEECRIAAGSSTVSEVSRTTGGTPPGCYERNGNLEFNKATSEYIDRYARSERPGVQLKETGHRAVCKRAASSFFNEPGFDSEGNVNYCRRESYIRWKGVGPRRCPPGKEKIGLLCYDKCPKGYKRFGIDCHQTCPKDWRDDGLFCRPSGRRGTEYGRGVGFGWWWGKTGKQRCEESEGKGKCEKYGLLHYPKCADGYEYFGCCICKRVLPDCKALGFLSSFLGSCTKRVISGTKSHSALLCMPNQDKRGLLCYDKCKPGFVAGKALYCTHPTPPGWTECTWDGLEVAANKKVCESTKKIDDDHPTCDTVVGL